MIQIARPIILPVPHVPQRKDGECLAACVAMILGYRGVQFSYQRLLKLLDIKDYGAPFPNLRKLASAQIRVSLKNRGTLHVLESLLHQNHPCIVSIDTGELPYWHRRMQHAVVVVGIDSMAIYINDPDLEQGPVAVNQGDFILAWLPLDEEYALIY